MKQSVLVSTFATTSDAALTTPASLHSGAVSDDLMHDLRQPLGAIEALAYYLELTSTDEKTRYQAQQIQMMVKKANRILSNAASPSATPGPAVLVRSPAS